VCSASVLAEFGRRAEFVGAREGGQVDALVSSCRGNMKTGIFGTTRRMITFGPAENSSSAKTRGSYHASIRMGILSDAVMFANSS
jgi:hypothetical protein